MIMQHWKRACTKGVRLNNSPGTSSTEQKSSKVQWTSIHHRWTEDAVFRMRMHGEGYDEQEILEWDKVVAQQHQLPIREMSWAERRAKHDNLRRIVSTQKGGGAGTKPVSAHPQIEEMRGKAKAAKKEYIKAEYPTTKTERSPDPPGATQGSASSSGQHGWGEQTQWTEASQPWWQTWSWSKWSWK